MDENSLIQPTFGNNHSQKGKNTSPGHATYFMRGELMSILNIYGRMVTAGEWRDYAIDHLKDRAVFSIFRRTSEMPLYRIIKEPARVRQQGAWRIIGMDGRIVKRGHELSQLLRYFDRHLVKAIN